MQMWSLKNVFKGESKQETHMVWIQLFLFAALHTIHWKDVAQSGSEISRKFPTEVEMFRIVRFGGARKGVNFAVSSEGKNSYENIFLFWQSKYCLCCVNNHKF